MMKRNCVAPCDRIMKCISIFGVGLVMIIALCILACYMPQIKASREIKDMKLYGLALVDGMDSIEIPDHVKIVGLGEATHGNLEFQDMKLELLKMLVEKYDFSAFAMEIPNCDGMKIDHYIRGEMDDEMTAEMIIKDISYPIYNTDSMVMLIEYMKEYNSNVKEEEQLRFYGFDMQGLGYDVECLENDLEKLLGIIPYEEDKKVICDRMEDLEFLRDPNNSLDQELAEEMIVNMKLLKEILIKSESLLAGISYIEEHLHTLDVCIQYIKYYSGVDTRDYKEGFSMRDSFMADNLEWMQTCEEERSTGKILISAHNGHINKKENVFGGYISEKYGEDYYTVGTGFFLSNDNINDSRRLTVEYTRNNHRFCSGDILAYQAKYVEGERYYLELDKVPKGSDIYSIISKPNYMGYIGEGYSADFYLYPEIYVRNKEVVAEIFDAMIYVYHVNPIKVLE